MSNKRNGLSTEQELAAQAECSTSEYGSPATLRGDFDNPRIEWGQRLKWVAAKTLTNGICKSEGAVSQWRNEPRWQCYRDRVIEITRAPIVAAQQQQAENLRAVVAVRGRLIQLVKERVSNEITKIATEINTQLDRDNDEQFAVIIQRSRERFSPAEIRLMWDAAIAKTGLPLKCHHLAGKPEFWTVDDYIGFLGRQGLQLPRVGLT